MVNEFSAAVFPYSVIYSIDEGELIRMHRYPYIITFNEIPDHFELFSEMFLPIKPADGMRGKRNKV